MTAYVKITPYGRLVVAVRRYVAESGHLRNCKCHLCTALAEIDNLTDPNKDTDA